MIPLKMSWSSGERDEVGEAERSRNRSQNRVEHCDRVSRSADVSDQPRERIGEGKRVAD